MANTGATVIEDWRLTFTVSGDHKEIMDQLGTGPMGMIDVGYLKHKRTHIEGNKIFFSPRDNELKPYPKCKLPEFVSFPKSGEKYKRCCGR